MAKRYDNPTRRTQQAATHRTHKQAAFLAKLVLSSAFTDEEANRARAWLESPAATVEATSRAIDKAKQRIEARDSHKAASQRRRDEYRASQPMRHTRRFQKPVKVSWDADAPLTGNELAQAVDALYG